MMRYVWLDVDPGHDDATAILLALHCQNICLLGISTTFGNAPQELTTINAARCLRAFGAPKHILVYPGATKPLLVPVRYAAGIHGPDGLGGVEHLPPGNSPDVLSYFAKDDSESVHALEGMARHIKDVWKGGAGHQVVVVSTGPMTNIALFVSAYPHLLPAVEEFVFMGGAVGMGNRSAVAEFNIMGDPHAAQIVLDAPVKKTMIPINVTHTAIVTKQIHARLLSPDTLKADSDLLPLPATTLRRSLSTLISYFADSYKAVFGFNDGPPLHDALTIGYISRPQLFKAVRKRVDVELNGTHSTGETVVDIWNYRACDDTWGSSGKNCLVVQSLDVHGFFSLLLECVSRCDEVSPLNVKQREG